MSQPLVITGAGAPVTVVAHGLGASVAETRPLLSGVPGTKAFTVARGHGDAPAGSGGYAELAADLLVAADACGATQALGVSLGAHTVLRLLTCAPDRFARVVLFLPASLDTPRPVRPSGLLAALTSGDAQAVRAAVRAELPADLEAEAYVAARTAYLLASPGLPTLVAGLDLPVPSRAALAAVTAEVLVLAQEGDPLHPASVARELVDLLPQARLVVFDQPGVLFRERPRLRALIVDHLSP